MKEWLKREWLKIGWLIIGIAFVIIYFMVSQSGRYQYLVGYESGGLHVKDTNRGIIYLYIS